MSAAELARIAAEVSSCPNCRLAQTRVRAVPGEGPPNARVMLVGEAPGVREDQQGRPFVGPSGQFLAELLGIAGLRREDVFITNIVKCRPPGNRDPQPDEIAACSDYLTRQTAALGPRIVVTLGRFSLSRFLPGRTISRVHGEPQRVGTVTVFPMYHPAAALHQRALRQTLLDDMAKLPAILAALDMPDALAPPPSTRPRTDESPSQLSLF